MKLTKDNIKDTLLRGTIEKVDPGRCAVLSITHNHITCTAISQMLKRGWAVYAVDNMVYGDRTEITIRPVEAETREVEKTIVEEETVLDYTSQE